jgi:hypothetical protein
MIARLLNEYLDKLSAVVLEHGGTLDKFVGDAVVAFWGAPIAYADDGARAVKAAIAMYRAGEEFRRNAPPGVPPIGRTRVGVHFGEAIVGNFGGDGRIQYTALGDAMNTAARLEGANKPLRHDDPRQPRGDGAIRAGRFEQLGLPPDGQGGPARAGNAGRGVRAGAHAAPEGTHACGGACRRACCRKPRRCAGAHSAN